MTEESERAAKWSMVEQLRITKEHLAVLENAMQNAGQQMASFAEALKAPEKYIFEVGKQEIRVLIPNSERLYASVSQASLSLESLCELINDYQDTVRKRNQLTAQLRSAGLPLP